MAIKRGRRSGYGIEGEFKMERRKKDLKPYYGNYEPTSSNTAKHSDELEHHGILGMRWGVRRYQNYDGSYTREGMKRYRQSEANYKKADDTYKTAKNLYKQTKKKGYADVNGNKLAVSKNVVKEAKQQRKEAKRDLSRKYDQLKRDKLGDEGKKLYNSGHTITGDSSMTYLMLQGAGAVAAGATYANKSGILDKKYVPAAYAVSVGMAAVGGIMKLKNASDARKLRAYYGHSRPD